MSEMLDRVAKAIEGHFSASERAYGVPAEAARDAVEAMREATNYMCSWGPYIDEINPNVPPITTSQADAAWTAMINAALASKIAPNG